MYHLEGPRIFIEQGGFFPHQDRWWINMPFTIEMLFTIGLAFDFGIVFKIDPSITCDIICNCNLCPCTQNFDT